MIANYDDDDPSASQCTPTVLRPLKKQIRNKNIETDEKIDDLETEILILRRQLPKLRDMNGKDVTNEMMLLHEMIDKQKLKIEKLEAAAEAKEREHLIQTSRIKKDHHKKYQSFREEIESSIISEIQSPQLNNNVQGMIEKARTLVAAEYQARVEAQAADIEALNAEIAQKDQEIEALQNEKEELGAQIEDLAEQKEEDDIRRNGYDEMRQAFETEIALRDKAIRGLRKLIPPSIRDIEGVEKLSGRDLVIHRLKSELNILDRHWEENRTLKQELEKFIQQAQEKEETASQVCDQLALEREYLRNELSPDFTEPTEPSSSISNGRDVGEALIRVSKLKQLITPLISHLKSITQYIKDVPGLSNHSEYQQLLQKILDVTVDLDTTMHEVTVAAEDLEVLERSIYGSPLIPPKTPQEKTSDRALMNEVSILRKRVADEIMLKQQYYHQLQEAQSDVENLRIRIKEAEQEADHLRKRIQELVDEKQTLQEQLEELGENENHSEDAEKLREALKDARDSLKRKSMELKEAKQMIEDLSKQKEGILNEYDKLQADLDRNADNVDKLVEAYQKMEAERNAIEEEFSKATQAANGYKNLMEKLDTKVKSLTAENAALKQNGSNTDENNDGKYYKRYIDLMKYIKAILLKLEGQTTEEPKRPSCIDAQSHERLIMFMQSHSLETKTKFGKALEVFKKIHNQDSVSSDISIASNKSVADGVVHTLSTIILEMTKCFDKAEEIILYLKRCMADQIKMDISKVMEMTRELRNFFHLSIKFFKAKELKIQNGRNPSEIAGELGRIHDHLLDIGQASKCLNSQEIKVKGRSYS